MRSKAGPTNKHCGAPVTTSRSPAGVDQWLRRAPALDDPHDQLTAGLRERPLGVSVDIHMGSGMADASAEGKTIPSRLRRFPERVTRLLQLLAERRL
jgi:hypothetical protein